MLDSWDFSSSKNYTFVHIIKCPSLLK
uniref:Uncharacterized protein n=1 Tax=Lepeophtheirus salmonis TaxID=72036 RepID=A0A0K2VC88_LEPSM